MYFLKIIEPGLDQSGSTFVFQNKLSKQFGMDRRDMGNFQRTAHLPSSESHLITWLKYFQNDNFKFEYNRVEGNEEDVQPKNNQEPNEYLPTSSMEKARRVMEEFLEICHDEATSKGSY